MSEVRTKFTVKRGSKPHDNIRIALIDVVDSKEIGYIHLVPLSGSNYMEILNVEISPEWQRQGLGTKLYLRAKIEANKAGYDGLASDPGGRTTDATKLWAKIPGAKKVGRGWWVLEDKEGESMPLNKSCSLDAYRANVKELIESGKKPQQAVAIAIRTLKKVCGVSSDARMSPKSIVGEATASLPKLREMVLGLRQFCRKIESTKYDSFDDVLMRFEDMGVTLRPSRADELVVANFKKQNEMGGDKDFRGYWKTVAKQCNTVSECLRIYGLALDSEAVGLDDIFHKRAMQLANEGRWISFDEI